jgi:tetratricopeptide (TPR) repeat protein
MPKLREPSVSELREKAEKALSSNYVVEARGHLETLLRVASEPLDRVFAHRHLGELLLEESPWRAALHLRQVLRLAPDDDVAEALMGLCQALLGNYEAAIASYRRAADANPDMPWYHHNVGHLLDVALDRPEAARRHLERAHAIEPQHDEITASLAHCIARLGDLDEARRLALEAAEMAPHHDEHHNLLDWIEQGAPEPTEERDEPRLECIQGGARDGGDEVRRAFERGMMSAGFSHSELESARRMWRDFTAVRAVRTQKPAVLAAAVEYAIALVHKRRGSTQAVIARRYGVNPNSLSQRYSELRETLDLRPSDPRYRDAR